MLAAVSAGLVGGGASSLIGSYATEALGGDFKIGWVGGQISGLLTGAGVGAGGHIFTSSVLQSGASVGKVIEGLGAVIGFSGTGGFLGGTASSMYTQNSENKNIDVNKALKNGLLSGSIASISWPFSAVSSALSSAGASIMSTIISLIGEGIFDVTSYYAGTAN